MKEGSRPVNNVAFQLGGRKSTSPASTQTVIKTGDHASLDPREFANNNDIKYSLDQHTGIPERSTLENLTPVSENPPHSGPFSSHYQRHDDS